MMVTGGFFVAMLGTWILSMFGAVSTSMFSSGAPHVIAQRLARRLLLPNLLFGVLLLWPYVVLTPGCWSQGRLVWASAWFPLASLLPTC